MQTLFSHSDISYTRVSHLAHFEFWNIFCGKGSMNLSKQGEKPYTVAAEALLFQITHHIWTLSGLIWITVTFAASYIMLLHLRGSQSSLPHVNIMSKFPFPAAFSVIVSFYHTTRDQRCCGSGDSGYFRISYIAKIDITQCLRCACDESELLVTKETEHIKEDISRKRVDRGRICHYVCCEKYDRESRRLSP